MTVTSCDSLPRRTPVFGFREKVWVALFGRTASKTRGTRDALCTVNDRREANPTQVGWKVTDPAPVSGFVTSSHPTIIALGICPAPHRKGPSQASPFTMSRTLCR